MELPDGSSTSSSLRPAQRCSSPIKITLTFKGEDSQSGPRAVRRSDGISIDPDAEKTVAQQKAADLDRPAGNDQPRHGRRLGAQAGSERQSDKRDRHDQPDTDDAEPE